MTTTTSSCRVRALRFVAAAVLTIAAVPAAMAYSGLLHCNGKPVTWKGARATMLISTASFPPGSVWDALLQNAMANWNTVPGSGFGFFVGRDTDGAHSVGNGVNEISWGNISDHVPYDALAWAPTLYHCKTAQWFWESDDFAIDESDIVFNAWPDEPTGGHPTFYTDPFNYESELSTGMYSAYQFGHVALHELGHSLGLGHENSFQAIMGTPYPSGGPQGSVAESAPLTDDRNGLRTLYPGTSRGLDIAASTFKFDSSHHRSVFIRPPVNGMRGSNITVEFTFANQGTEPATFDIGFYLSDDSNITVGDRLLGINYGAYASHSFLGTFSRELYIPADVPEGTYYLGFILDINNANAEMKEYNNHQHYPQRITIYCHRVWTTDPCSP